MIVISNRSGLGARFGQATVREFDAAGFQSAVCVPLPGTRGTLGALALGWATPHQVDVTERAVLTAIAATPPWPSSGPYTWTTGSPWAASSSGQC
jgi:hypothetical protein